MPLYEYACKKCDHHFDVRHSHNEVPELVCPICQSEVRKVFHAAGIIFKGDGWYITDNAKKSSITSAEKSEKTEKTEEKSATSPVTTPEKSAESTEKTEKTPVAAAK